MNKIKKQLQLAGKKIMPKMHLTQTGFTYNVLTKQPKNEEKNPKETRVPKYIYQNKLNKACFHHDMASGGFIKNLPRKTIANIVLRVKAIKITKNSKYDGYHRGLTSTVYKFFD